LISVRSASNWGVNSRALTAIVRIAEVLNFRLVKPSSGSASHALTKAVSRSRSRLVSILVNMHLQ